MKFFSGASPLESVSGPENPRPFTAVKARGAHGALRASHSPLGEFALKDQEAFPNEKNEYFLYKRFNDNDSPPLNFGNARLRNTPQIR